jgi:hypothetical protein
LQHPIAGSAQLILSKAKQTKRGSSCESRVAFSFATLTYWISAANHFSKAKQTKKGSSGISSVSKINDPHATLIIIILTLKVFFMEIM